MSDFGTCCTSRCTCRLLALIASIIIGFVTVLLRITAVITVTPAFLWVLFGIAVVYLLALLYRSYSAGRAGNTSCVCCSLGSLTAGILGTVLTSVVLLGIEFAATSIIGAIITGALLFFFSLIITSSACLVRCACSSEN